MREASNCATTVRGRTRACASGRPNWWVIFGYSMWSHLRDRRSDIAVVVLGRATKALATIHRAREERKDRRLAQVRSFSFGQRHVASRDGCTGAQHFHRGSLSSRAANVARENSKSFRLWFCPARGRWCAKAGRSNGKACRRSRKGAALNAPGDRKERFRSGRAGSRASRITIGPWRRRLAQEFARIAALKMPSCSRFCSVMCCAHVPNRSNSDL